MIDLLDPEVHARGEAGAALDEQRARCPVAWRAGRHGPGYWAVTGHAELTAIARDPETFTSHLGTRPEVRRAAGAPRPLHNLDGAAHARLRAIANQLVAPARTAALAWLISHVTGEAIADFVAAGGGDAVPALAVALPAQIFAAWLGVPRAEASLLAARVEAIHAAGAALLEVLGTASPALAARRLAARDATTALATWLRDGVTADGAPAGSVLADLRARVASAELTLLEATMLAALFVEAGLPTVTDAIAGGLAACRARPTDVPLAVEEMLRVVAPIQQFARYATRDVMIAGAAIRAGQQVVLWYGAANRDPRVFADPTSFVLRPRNAHVAFGAGPHRCLGARFARDLLRTFFAAWFARVPAHDAVGTRRASSYMHGYRALRISL